MSSPSLPSNQRLGWQLEVVFTSHYASLAHASTTLTHEHADYMYGYS